MLSVISSSSPSSTRIDSHCQPANNPASKSHCKVYFLRPLLAPTILGSRVPRKQTLKCRCAHQKFNGECSPNQKLWSSERCKTEQRKELICNAVTGRPQPDPWGTDPWGSSLVLGYTSRLALQQKRQAFISLHCIDIRCKLPLKRRHDFGGGNSWLRAMRGVGLSCNQF